MPVRSFVDGFTPHVKTRASVVITCVTTKKVTSATPWSGSLSVKKWPNCLRNWRGSGGGQMNGSVLMFHGSSVTTVHSLAVWRITQLQWHFIYSCLNAKVKQFAAQAGKTKGFLMHCCAAALLISCNFSLKATHFSPDHSVWAPSHHEYWSTDF